MEKAAPRNLNIKPWLLRMQAGHTFQTECYLTINKYFKKFESKFTPKILLKEILSFLQLQNGRYGIIRKLLEEIHILLQTGFRSNCQRPELQIRLQTGFRRRL